MQITDSEERSSERQGSLSLPHLLKTTFFIRSTHENLVERGGIQGKNAGIDNGYGPIINDCLERREDKHAGISSVGKKKAGRSEVEKM